jgi:hypothetical protein
MTTKPAPKGEIILYAEYAEPHRAMALVARLLDPEGFGFAVSAEVRDAARVVLGRQPVEQASYIPSIPRDGIVAATAGNHTAGPWTWWSSNSFLRLTGADGEDGGVLSAACVRGAYATVKVRPGDMRLIAAAPDLLAACLLAAPHHQGFNSEAGRALSAAIMKANQS